MNRGAVGGGTVVTRSHLRQAQAAATAFCAAHPQATFTIVIADAVAGDAVADDRVHVIPASRLVDADDLWLRFAGYTSLELCCSLKPNLLRFLLEENQVAAYIDSDVILYEPIEDVFALALRSGITLTRHALKPSTARREETVLIAGTFNAGLIAVGPASKEFLDWWGERIEFDCVIDSDRGVFLDQSWLDLVPSFFGCAVVDDPTVNLLWTRLAPEEVEWNDGSPTLNRRPIRAFHFTGFDLIRAATFYETERSLEENSGIWRLAQDWQRRVQAVDEHDLIGFEVLDPGLMLAHPVARAALRRERRDGDMAGDPGGLDQPELWLSERNPRYGLTRWLLGLYELNGSLRELFPDALSGQSGEFEWWASRPERGLTTIDLSEGSRISPEGADESVQIAQMLGLGRRHRKGELVDRLQAVIARDDALETDKADLVLSLEVAEQAFFEQSRTLEVVSAERDARTVERDASQAAEQAASKAASEEIAELRVLLERSETTLHRITTGQSWRLTAPLRLLARALRRARL